MVGYINSWAKGIIFAIVITGIIEIIIPEGNNKKYVKTVIGIYIVFVVIYPIVSKFTGRKINIDSLINKTEKEVSMYKKENIVVETNKYIEDTYKEKIKEDINNKAKEKGYKIDYLTFDIENKEEEKFGEILRINMKISKFDKNDDVKENTSNTNVEKIKNIEINITNSYNREEIYDFKNTDLKIDDNEVDSFKEYLSSSYGIDKSKIHINEYMEE